MTTAAPFVVSQATDAVDGVFVTKDAAVRQFSATRGIPLSRIAAIGDSETDLPFLTIPGIALAGCPANSQSRVKDTLRAQTNGVLLDGEVLDGFDTFYAQCTARGIEVIFADKDGVLLWHGHPGEIERIAPWFASMGHHGRPTVRILTGSSAALNVDLCASLAAIPAVRANPVVHHDPAVFHVENGALVMNLLTGGVVREPGIDSEVFEAPAGRIATGFRIRLAERVLPRFGLTWSMVRHDQASKLYMPPKQVMVTVNVPRSHDGHTDYRRAAESDVLREAMAVELLAAAEDAGVRATRLSPPSPRWPRTSA